MTVCVQIMFFNYPIPWKNVTEKSDSDVLIAMSLSFVSEAVG